MMNINWKPAMLLVLVVALLSASLSLFTVKEGKSALIIRLGELHQAEDGTAKIYRPGLHVKWPLIDHVSKFDMRIKTYDVQSSRILTAEQKYVLVDYYVKWRIQDVGLYYKRTGGHDAATTRLLSQKVNDALRAAFGQRNIAEVISGERLHVMHHLREQAAQDASDLGIRVVDVRIKRIDLPREVSESVYQRMSTDRERIATRHRSNGQAVAEKLRAKADAKVIVIDADARKQAAVIRAQGHQKAIELLNTHYRRAPKLFWLLDSVSAYQKAFADQHSFLVLSPDMPFFDQMMHFDSVPNRG